MLSSQLEMSQALCSLCAQPAASDAAQAAAAGEAIIEGLAHSRAGVREPGRQLPFATHVALQQTLASALARLKSRSLMASDVAETP